MMLTLYAKTRHSPDVRRNAQLLLDRLGPLPPSRLGTLTSIGFGHPGKIETSHHPATLTVASAVDMLLGAKGALGAVARLERSARVRQAAPFDMHTADCAAEAASAALGDLSGQGARRRVHSELAAVADRLMAHSQEPSVAKFLADYSTLGQQRRPISRPPRKTLP